MMKCGEASGRWGRHQSSGTYHEESRVHHSPGRRNDLAAASVERLLSDDGVQDFKLDIPDGWGQQKDWVMATLKLMWKQGFCLIWRTFVTQRSLPGAPLEALNNAVFDWAEQRLVHLHRRSKHLQLAITKKKKNILSWDVLRSKNH